VIADAQLTSVAADLRAAANVIRGRGRAVSKFVDVATGAVCLLGAIRVAITGDPCPSHGQLDLATLKRINRADLATDAYVTRHRLARFRATATTPAAAWSDRVASSAGEVAELLEAVAAELDTRAEVAR
jgi:hypothetical protein